MEKILVTGGAGYIGSNVVNMLVNMGLDAQIFIVDNLSTGHRKSLNPKAKFFKVNLTDFKALRDVFKKIKPDVVFHFGGVSQVGESNKKPKKYIKNNVIGGLSLLNSMAQFDCKKIIFSSSASVYGNPKKIPITESHPLSPISVYGETKVAFEKLLESFRKTYGIKYLSLRYFNAGGASENNKYGEIHDPETHLIPTILKSIKKGSAFNVFGDDYKTNDGTCVRDYVHVIDIAKAHVLGMKYLNKKTSSSETINLGTGKGFSVKEILTACEKVTGKKIKVNISERRKGDPATLIASNSKAKKILDWKPEKTINDIVKSAWKFEKSK